jgi:putative SOS response-associated peptidase YedK
MCGRYVSTKSTGDLLDEFDAVDATDDEDVAPDYNVAPTVRVRTVVNRPPRVENVPYNPDAAPIRQLRIARWGLVPSWAKDLSASNRLFNARSETIAEKAAFKRAFAKRRCLIPADGWYEWLRDTDSDGKPRKQPYLMIPEDGHSLAFAGLYEFWKPAASDADLLLSVTILTVPSQGPLEEVHDRMPLVLARTDWQRWLDPALAGPTDLLTGQDEASREALEVRPVSSDVNSVNNNFADLLGRVEPPVKPLELF